jgi:hypothetical protein
MKYIVVFFVLDKYHRPGKWQRRITYDAHGHGPWLTFWDEQAIKSSPALRGATALNIVAMNCVGTEGLQKGGVRATC